MSKQRRKPILALDFDGVLHSYERGWQGASIISDPPVNGAMQFLLEAVVHFEVNIYSSRSHQWGGRRAMRRYVYEHLRNVTDALTADDCYSALRFPRHKPSAMIGLDDRVLTFEGTFPKPSELLKFKPWNKR